jgi:hypothetical protein
MICSAVIIIMTAVTACINSEIDDIANLYQSFVLILLMEKVDADPWISYVAK